MRGYAGRHRVRPGITGLAQVKGLRGEIRTVERAKRRVELDKEYIDRWSLGSTSGSSCRPFERFSSTAMPTERENFLDVAFDVLPVDRLLSRIGAVSSDSAFQYLVTPNVDHMVRLHKRRGDIAGLADAYRTADLCVCDSKVLARLARWRGRRTARRPGQRPDGLALRKSHRGRRPCRDRRRRRGDDRRSEAQVPRPSGLLSTARPWA